MEVPMPVPRTPADGAVTAGEPAETTVRQLLAWFGAYRRSLRNVKRVRDALDEVGLITFPDFETEYIDAVTISAETGTSSGELRPSSLRRSHRIMASVLGWRRSRRNHGAFA